MYTHLLILVISLTLCFTVSLSAPGFPGDPCDPITDPCTSVERTECRKDPSGVYVCICDDGWVTDTLNKRCIAMPTLPDDACAPNDPPANCQLIPNTECVQDGGEHKCKCVGNLVTLPGRCLVRPTMPGEECDRTLAPCPGGTDTTCMTESANYYYCKCNGDLVTDVPGKKCLKKPLKPGDSCHPSLTPCQGVDSTTCTLNNSGEFVCLCPSGYYTDVAGGRCLRIPTAPGDSCDLGLTPCAGVTNTTCVTDAGGTTYYCKCNGELVTDTGGRVCLEKPDKPGNSCHPTLTPCEGIAETECRQDGPQEKFYCKCVGEYVNDLEGFRCLRIPQLPGQECNPTTAPCTGIPQTECKRHDDGLFRCICDGTLITDIVNSRCIVVPQKPGDSCAPAVPQANCLSISDTECVIDGGQHICKCKGSLVTLPLPGKCLAPPTFPGEECHPVLATCPAVTDTTCVVNSVSPLEYYCRCNGDLVTDVTAKKCLIKPQKPGHSCHPSLTPCVGLDLTLTSCLLNDSGQYTCLCLPEYFTDVPGERCLRIPTAPGDLCDPSLTPCAHVTNTTCVTDIGDTLYYCKCNGELVTDPSDGNCLEKPKKPGNSCHPSFTPCDLVDNTQCLQDSPDNRFYCKCTGDFVNDFVLERCLKKPQLPGQECLPIVAPCTDVDKTECRLHDGAGGQYLCMCDTGYVTDIPNARCLTYPALPGDPCEVNLAPCSTVSNTTCEIFPPYPTLCKCTVEFVTDIAGRRCVKIPTKPGQICEPGFTDCSGTTEETICEESPDQTYSYCKCIGDGKVTDPVAEVCLTQPAEPGDSCHVTLTPCENIGNTTCDETTKICTCVDPFITDVTRKRCLTLPGFPGDHCDPMLTPCTNVTETDCRSYADDHYCRCTGDLITDPDYGLCITLPVKPGDLCHPNDANCEGVTNTTCQAVDGQTICKCIEDFITDPVNGRCLTTPSKPGDSCDPILTPCNHIPLTECSSNGAGDYFCKCDDGYFTDVTNGRCIRYPVKPGDACIIEFDLCDLIANTTCTDEGEGPYCKCNWDLITDGGKCFPKPTNPGDDCGPNLAPCTGIENTECQDDGNGFYCKCTDGYFTDFIFKQCLPHPLKPGERCDVNNERTCLLVPHTTCNPIGEGVHRCTCNTGYFQDDDCHPLPSKPSDRCLAQEHCDIIPNTECVVIPGLEAKFCQCRQYFDPSWDGSKCIAKATNVNDPCETNLQCTLIENSRCTIVQPSGESRCICNPGTVSNNAGSSCLEVIQELGKQCIEHVQCTSGLGPNVECNATTSTCNCIEGFVGNELKNQCLKVSSIRGDCAEDIQCTTQLGDHSVCRSSKCACTEDAGFLNTGCHRKIELNYPCEYSEQCILGVNEYAYCSGTGSCNCYPNLHIWNRTCYADLSIGSPCLTDPECFVPVPQSTCKDNTCNCGNRTGSGVVGSKTCGAEQIATLKHGTYLLLSLITYVFQ